MEKKSDDVYVCGLVTSKDVDREITRLVLEDPTGLFEGIIFDKDLQEKAGMLLSDQLVVARAGVWKNSGFVIKELILPDVPDQPKNRSEAEVFCRVSL